MRLILLMFTKKKKFKKLKLVSGTITWREVKPGICFVGVCVENDCKARNDIVVINRGFNEYGFVLNYVVHHLNCPKCEKEINTKILQGIGLYKCIATIETMLFITDRMVKNKRSNFLLGLHRRQRENNLGSTTSRCKVSLWKQVLVF